MADTGTLTVQTAKEIADKVLLEALRKVRADQDDFWTFYQADPLMVKAADRIEELLAWHGTEQSMHAAWRKRAEEAEAQLAAAASPAPKEAHRCPRCGRRMQSDFDEDVGVWYECANCDYREAVSNSTTPPAPLVSDCGGEG